MAKAICLPELTLHQEVHCTRFLQPSATLLGKIFWS